MIDVATNWDEGEMKKELIYVIANHMKKCFLKWNKDSVDDVVIFNHILELSNGKIKIDKNSKPLTDSPEFQGCRAMNLNVTNIEMTWLAF